MASEDSDQFVPGFSMVHGLRDLSDLDQPFSGQMKSGVDALHALRKTLEVVLLRGSKRIPLEERNDPLE
jgi:hypothetical protein